MNTLPILTLTLLTLILSTRASEELEASDNCVVKSSEGIYSYDPTSDSGPASWGGFEGFESCGKGHAQSPIDFTIDVQYQPVEKGPQPYLGMAELELSAGSYNWALKCPEGHDCGYTTFNGKKYKFVNLHFHHPSEHKLNGKQFPLESHMVHATEDGDLGVVATMYDYAPESYANTVYTHNNREFGKSKLLNGVIKHLYKGMSKFPVYMASVIEPEKGYCTYVGSLTTPPCSEGVTFMMSNAVQMVSKRQVAKYALSSGAGFDGNNRPTQPMNGRNITCYV